MAAAVEKNKSSKKNINKYLINALVMLLVTAIAVVFILKDDPAEVFGYLAGSKISYILIALGIILLYYLVEGLILMVLARMYKRNYPYYKGFFNCMIGTFFSGITPSNSGGQFVQAYTFSKQGVRVSNAASILLMHFIVHQVVSVLFSAFVLIFKFEELRAYTQTIDIFGFKFEILALSVIGFSINAIIIFGLFFAAFSKRLHHFITTTGVNIMYKLHLTKDKDQKALELSTKFETFRIELKRLFQNAQILIITVILFLIKMVLYNLVPYFIGLALGAGFHSTNDINNVIDCVSMSLFSTTITSMVPIPGASGGAELAFKMLFENLFVASGNKINAIILVWRAITYYFGLILGLIIFVTYREAPKKEYLHGNSKTLLQLRVVTLEDEKKTLEMVEEEEYEEVLTPEMIEERFRKLKEELSSKLKENETSIIEEDKD